MRLWPVTGPGHRELSPCGKPVQHREQRGRRPHRDADLAAGVDLTLDDVDLPNRCITMAGHRQRLGELTRVAQDHHVADQYGPCA